MSTVAHLVVGPAEHGVVRHGVLVAQACGDRLIRAERWDELADDDLSGVGVLHLPFTDRLFAPTCEEAAAAVGALADRLDRAGVALSVTLHDLPAGDAAVEDRRRAAYGRVLGRAVGWVVNSRRELGLLDAFAPTTDPWRPRSLRMIPLPVEPPPPASEVPGPVLTGAGDVVVLGFVFPDRGYEQVIEELPPGAPLVALGRPSAGHDDLVERLTHRAASAGHAFRVTGFVPDDRLGAALRSAGVPVAPNRRVAASGSIATWVGHGRRPMVPDTAYTRELEERWPGALRRYDADRPGALGEAIAEALRDPASTRTPPDVRFGPGLPEVAADYRVHLLGCRPPAALRVSVRHWAVPDNRSDLLDWQQPPDPPAVSVVVPYYRGQRQLDLVLAGLAAQRHPASRLQVVVADDGSPEPPQLTAGGDLNVTVVRQPDRGFRAAAARNLGARAAEGDVLLFLDGDTVPEPDYVSRLSRLPALLPDALVVGRRRHADLDGWSAADVTGWLVGNSVRPPTELPEPAWLRDGYRDSDDLRRADPRSYRYVISAVCGLHRDLFGELGGFSEEFDAYGGEDWELAHRAWVAGAVLAHVPDAVAWHDGPDWAGRTGDAAKNSETLALARLLPDPVARGGGQWLPYPAVVVTLPDPGPAALLALARQAYASGADCGFWVGGETADDTVGALADPRLRTGVPPADILARARVVVELDRPVRLERLSELVATAETHGPLRLGSGRVLPSRARNRARRWADALGLDTVEAEALLFGGRDRSADGLDDPLDLVRELARAGRVQPSSRS